MAERVKNDDLLLLINAIRIHRETGGNLVSMVETIEETARERVKIRGEVWALTAQASLGGWVITLLPVVLGGFLYLLNPSGISFFWTDWTGAIMGGAAVFNVLLGNLLLRRITKIEL
jgi:tight adherence protein B